MDVPGKMGFHTGVSMPVHRCWKLLVEVVGVELLFASLSGRRKNFLLQWFAYYTAEYLSVLTFARKIMLYHYTESCTMSLILSQAETVAPHELCNKCFDTYISLHKKKKTRRV